jgi:hypothetical protein
MAASIVMPRPPDLLKAVAIGALLAAGSAAATGVEKVTELPVPACKANDSKCVKPKAAPKRLLFDTLKGSSETTRLPDTARLDARGGTLI